MFSYLSRLVYKFQSKPVQTALAGALLVLVVAVLLVSLVRWLRRRRQGGPTSWPGLFTGAVGNVLKVLVGLALAGGLCAFLRFQSEEFARQRGGVSQTNYEAVKTIWGGPMFQGELSARLATFATRYYDKDGLELDAAKLQAATQPIGFRKVEQEQALPGSPVVSAEHSLDVEMNYRRKGGASYPTFQTDCRFTYQVENFSGKDVTGLFSFPLPSGQGLIEDISVTVDGQPVRDSLVVNGDSASWKMPMPAGRKAAVAVGFRSRGMDYIRLAPGAGRELRRYRVQMACHDIDESAIDYPIGCMTPTEKRRDGPDLLLTWDLDRAVTTLCMGVILPKEKQEGYYVARILAAAPWGMVLLLGMVVVTHGVTGRDLKPGLLLVLSLGYVLYHLLMGHVGDYAPGLVGGMVIAGAALGGLMALAYLPLADRFTAVSVVGLFLLFCVVYPLIRINRHEGLLLTVLYVALLAGVIVLMVLRRARSAPA